MAHQASNFIAFIMIVVVKLLYKRKAFQLIFAIKICYFCLLLIMFSSPCPLFMFLSVGGKTGNGPGSSRGNDQSSTWMPGDYDKRKLPTIYTQL